MRTSESYETSHSVIKCLGYGRNWIGFDHGKKIHLLSTCCTCGLKKLQTFYHYSRLYLYFPVFFKFWKMLCKCQDFFKNSRLCRNPGQEIFFFSILSSIPWVNNIMLQYVVLGPRLKVINLNILPESSRNKLKYSLQIAFMFFSIILKFQVPDINILLGVRKKATVFDGPWSASQVSSTIKT